MKFFKVIGKILEFIRDILVALLAFTVLLPLLVILLIVAICSGKDSILDVIKLSLDEDYF